MTLGCDRAGSAAGATEEVDGGPGQRDIVAAGEHADQGTVG